MSNDPQILSKKIFESIELEKHINTEPKNLKEAFRNEWFSTSIGKKSKITQRITKLPIKKRGYPIGVGIDVKMTQTSGLGLFALKSFKKNEIITWYDGVIKMPVKFKPSQYTSHLISIGHVTMIEGLRVPWNGMGGGSFINSSSSKSIKNADFQIISLNEIEDLKVIKAVKNIEIGDEIFINYSIFIES